MVDFLVRPDIVVECEGVLHEFRQERDRERTDAIQSMGYRVFRIRNYDVFSNTVQIADMLRTAQLDRTNLSMRRVHVDS